MWTRRRKSRSNENGIALLLAVTVISLLVAVTVQFGKDMRRELVSSANILSSSKMNAILKSGHNIAEAVILQDNEDNNKADTFLDSWSLLNDENLDQFFGSGRLEVLVTDLGGRIQLNSLVDSKGKAGGKVSVKIREALLLLLLSDDFGDYSVDDATLIVDAITDWVDADDQESGIEETESSFYLSLEPSYSSKNGPMEFIEELLLIRGITKDLYYGTSETAALRSLVTVHGNDGKININTAPPQVLKSLSKDMSDELAEKMVQFRRDEANEDLLKNETWYRSVDPWPGHVTLEADIITTKSSYFHILSRAENNDMVKIMTSVIHRKSDGKVDLISRKVE